MKISQREAHRLRKRVEELEAILYRQKNRWSGNWSAGMVHIDTLVFSDTSYAKIETARLLGHAVVAIPEWGNKILFYADKL